MQSILDITCPKQFDDLLENAEGPVVVDFTATWCGPCQAIAPYFKQCAAMQECKHIIFVKVDVDDGEEIAAKCNISAMPTFQAYYKNKKIGEFTGARKDDLEKLVNKCLAEHFVDQQRTS